MTLLCVQLFALYLALMRVGIQLAVMIETEPIHSSKLHLWQTKQGYSAPMQLLSDVSKMHSTGADPGNVDVRGSSRGGTIKYFQETKTGCKFFSGELEDLPLALKSASVACLSRMLCTHVDVPVDVHAFCLTEISLTRVFFCLPPSQLTW